MGKHTNSIFTKLDLPQAPDDNRRVLAVLAWLEGQVISADLTLITDSCPPRISPIGSRRVK